VRQEVHPEAAGVAMFVGGPSGLREMLPLAVPLDNSFTVAELPRLRPLVEALGEAPRTAVLFVDGESARLVAVTEEGSGAVAQGLADLVDHYGLRAIIPAGEPRNVAVFRTHVPPRLTGRIVGDVAGARYEPTSVLAERARELVRHHAAGEAAVALDTVLADAEGGGRAAAGIEATIEAVNRGTVERLYLLRSLGEEGRACSACQALQDAASTVCRWCNAATRSIELGEAMIQRVLAAGGDVAIVDVHAGLARAVATASTCMTSFALR
jgi:hypothetical protein